MRIYNELIKVYILPALKLIFVQAVLNTVVYYSTIMSFYQIRSRERAKYEAVIHCSVLV